MRFHRQVTQEVRVLLLEQLKEYEANTPMGREERKELHNWVAKGRSPYDNGGYCYQYSTETDEIYFDMTAFPQPDVAECDLPFQ